MQPAPQQPGPTEPLSGGPLADDVIGGDCQAMILRLYHFLDGELTEDRRHTIMSHLEGCPSCFSAYDFEAELRIVVRERAQARVPESLMARIQVAIEVERRDCC
jgi:anti-sigma factor (TIGR02949 family)